MADFVAIDFETANEKRESACALGIAEVKNSEIVATQTWLIRPPDEHFKIRKRNREIHKLGRADLKNQLKFDGLWPTIASYFENRIVVAHNAVSFDIDVLRKLFDYFSIKPPEFKYLCTLELAQASWYDSLTSYDLAQIAQFLGCQFSHHNPKDDAVVCASFLIRACNDANAESVEELAESIGIDISPFSLVKRTSRRNHGGEVTYGLSISLAGMSVSTRDGHVGDVDSDDDLSESFCGYTKEGIRRRCGDSGVFRRGEKLFSENIIQITSKSAGAYKGLVAGSGNAPYEVSVDALLNAECTCQAWINNANRFCKHCVALALV